MGGWVSEGGDVKHTPGPWSVDDNPKSDFIDIEPMVCRIERGTLAHLDNARLIAAAPELLEACKIALVTAYEADVASDEDGGWMVKMRAAIAKAEGKPAKASQGEL